MNTIDKVNVRTITIEVVVTVEHKTSNDAITSRLNDAITSIYDSCETLSSSMTVVSERTHTLDYDH